MEDSIIYPDLFPFCIRELNELGQPFQQYDGVTTFTDEYGRDYPSGSSDQYTTVYGEGSYYPIKLTTSQIMQLFWSINFATIAYPDLTIKRTASASGTESAQSSIDESNIDLYNGGIGMYIFAFGDRDPNSVSTFTFADKFKQRLWFGGFLYASDNCNAKYYDHWITSTGFPVSTTTADGTPFNSDNYFNGFSPSDYDNLFFSNYGQRWESYMNNYSFYQTRPNEIKRGEAVTNEGASIVPAVTNEGYANGSVPLDFLPDPFKYRDLVNEGADCAFYSRNWLGGINPYGYDYYNQYFNFGFGISGDRVIKVKNKQGIDEYWMRSFFQSANQLTSVNVYAGERHLNDNKDEWESSSFYGNYSKTFSAAPTIGSFTQPVGDDNTTVTVGYLDVKYIFLDGSEVTQTVPTITQDYQEVRQGGNGPATGSVSIESTPPSSITVMFSKETPE